MIHTIDYNNLQTTFHIIQIFKKQCIHRCSKYPAAMNKTPGLALNYISLLMWRVLLDITDRPTYTCIVDTITHICSIVNSGSTCRLMIITIFHNDNIQKTAVTIS